LQEAFPVQDQADDIHDGLEKVFRVSEYLKFPFTLDEVANYFLPRRNLTAEQLRSILSGTKFPDIRFYVKDGYLLTNPNQLDSSRLEREKMSAAKLGSAASFAGVLRRAVPFIRTVAVTGSVAYGSADRWDDIDLFIVTRRNRLWLSAFMTLVLVRLNKLLDLRPPHLSLFCLSYVHDEEGFEHESQMNRKNPLFARELLKARPVTGVDQYKQILESNDWVGVFHSVAYAAKLIELKDGTDGRRVETKDRSKWFSFPLDWAEAIAYVLLSRYLRIRAYLTNLRLKAQGQNFRVFEPKMSAVSCVYTSNFYEWLRALWEE
jgi:hypothetical protein